MKLQKNNQKSQTAPLAKHAKDLNIQVINAKLFNEAFPYRQWWKNTLKLGKNLVKKYKFS